MRSILVSVSACLLATLFTGVPVDAMEMIELPEGVSWWRQGGGGMATGPDGNLWVSGLSLDSSSTPGIGRITTDGVVTVFPVPDGYFWWPMHGPGYEGPDQGGGGGGIAAGADGALWFTGLGLYDGNGSNVAVVGRIATDGTMTMFPYPGLGWSPFSNGNIVAGPSGRLWFTGLTLPGTNLGAVASTGNGGSIHPLPDAGEWGMGAAGIAAGPDGNLWISGAGARILRLTPTGDFTEFPLPPGHSWFWNGAGIASGPDGNLWFSGIRFEPYPDTSGIGRITTDGVITVFPLPANHRWRTEGDAITSGPDGNLWFSGVSPDYPSPFGAPDDGARSIGRITPAGSVATFPLSPSLGWNGRGVNLGIVSGPDGNIWFSGVFGNERSWVGRMRLDAVANPCDDLEPCTADSGSLAEGCTSERAPIPENLCRKAEQSKLLFDHPTSSAPSSVRWLWRRGEAFDEVSLGSPGLDTTYALCIWDMVDAVPYLVGDVHVRPSADLWRDLGAKGWKYADRYASSEGAQKIQLKPGSDGSTLVKFSAGGPLLEFREPAEPGAHFQMEPDVVVQLVNSDGHCWTSRYLPADVTSGSGEPFQAHSR